MYVLIHSLLRKTANGFTKLHSLIKQSSDDIILRECSYGNRRRRSRHQSFESYFNTYSILLIGIVPIIYFFVVTIWWILVKKQLKTWCI